MAPYNDEVSIMFLNMDRTSKRLAKLLDRSDPSSGISAFDGIMDCFAVQATHWGREMTRRARCFVVRYGEEIIENGEIASRLPLFYMCGRFTMPPLPGCGHIVLDHQFIETMADTLCGGFPSSPGYLEPKSGICPLERKTGEWLIWCLLSGLAKAWSPFHGLDLEINHIGAGLPKEQDSGPSEKYLGVSFDLRVDVGEGGIWLLLPYSAVDQVREAVRSKDSIIFPQETDTGIEADAKAVAEEMQGNIDWDRKEKIFEKLLAGFADKKIDLFRRLPGYVVSLYAGQLARCSIDDAGKFLEQVCSPAKISQVLESIVGRKYINPIFLKFVECELESMFSLSPMPCPSPHPLDH